MVFNNVKIESFEKVEDRDPDLYVIRARKLMAEGKTKEAVDELSKSVEFSDNDIRYLFEKFRTLFELKKYKESVVCLEQMIKIKPDASDLVALMGMILFYDLNYENEGLFYFIKAAEMNDFYKCLYLGEMNRSKDALGFINKVISINPNLYEAHKWKGITLSKLGRYNEALESFNAGLKINATYGDLYEYKCAPLSKLGMFDEIIRVTETAFEKCHYLSNENQIGLLWYKGNSCYEEKLYNDARASFDKILTIQEDIPGVYLDKIKTLKALALYDEVIRTCDQAINKCEQEYISEILDEKKYTTEYIKSQRKRGCYLTTAMCDILKKDDDCYELNILRRFRDEELTKTIDGLKIIHEYNMFAPPISNQLMAHIHKMDIALAMKTEYIDEIIKSINREANEEAISHYKRMVYYVESMVSEK